MAAEQAELGTATAGAWNSSSDSRSQPNTCAPSSPARVSVARARHAGVNTDRSTGAVSSSSARS